MVENPRRRLARKKFYNKCSENSSSQIVFRTDIFPKIVVGCPWSLDKEFVKEANKVIFDFIWKGKDKVKRSALISDIEDGGLKAPHLNSIIETQRVLCCKKLANDQPSGWKTILLHYLKPAGGKLVLCCDFDLKKFPIKLPAF